MTVVEILDANGTKKKIDVQTSGEGLEQLVADLAVKAAVEAVEAALEATLKVQLQAGTNAAGKLAANAGVNIGSVGLLPQTTGGLEPKRTIAAASTNATKVKEGAGQVFGWYISNKASSARYVKLYNKASAPTVGTDTPVMTIEVPKEGAANVEFTNGIAFSTGIALAITKGLADANTEVVAAEDVVVNLLVK